MTIAFLLWVGLAAEDEPCNDDVAAECNVNLLQTSFNMGFKSDDGTQAPAAVTAESYNGDYLAFWPPGSGSNNMLTSITNCAPAGNKFWYVTTSGQWKSADIVNEKFDLGEVITGGGQKGMILNDVVKGISIQLIFWPATATTPAKLWKSNTVPSGWPLAHRSFAQYKRAENMIGTTMCAVTSNGGFVCTNPDGGKQTGVFYSYPANPAKKFLWIWGQEATLLSLGPMYFPGTEVVLWKTMEPFTTINSNAYCGNAAIRPAVTATILEQNAGVNKCARWVQSNSACGSDFHYGSTNFYCECAPRGTSCTETGPPSYGFSAHHFDSAAAEVARRISLNPNGKRGTACTMSLSWNTEDDLDLKLTGAYTVDYSHEKITESGKVVAELNIDANYQGTKTSTPVENIITNVPKRGTYTLKVHGASKPYDIVVVCYGATMVHNGVTIQRGKFISASGVADSAIAAIEFEVVE